MLTEKPKIFAFAGVESTGKSNCAAYLAYSLHGKLIEEFARVYLEENSNQYKHEDFIKIARGQAELEDKALRSASAGDILVFDTDYIVIYVWSLIVYGSVPDWIQQRILSYEPRVYFLMTPEVEWVRDGLREYPDLKIREAIHQTYIDTLRQFGCRYHIINGDNHSVRQLEVLQIARSYLEQD